MNAFVELISRSGWEETTYEALSKKTGISRRLVQMYFSEKNRLFLVSMVLVRRRFIHFVLDKMGTAKDPETALRSYSDAVLAWPSEARADAISWGLFYYYCSVDQESRTVNNELVQTGQKRIAGLISALLKKKGKGSRSPESILTMSKQVQNLLTGAVVSLLTETVEQSLHKLQAEVFQSIKAIVGLP